MAGRATLTAKAGTGLNARVAIAGSSALRANSGLRANTQVIMQGHATSGTSFTARILRNFTANIQGRSVATFAVRQIQNAVVQVAGHATLRPNAPVAPVPINATVRLFGFAANQIAIDQIFGRATGRFNATLSGLPEVTVNGRATFVPRGTLLNRAKDSIAGKAVGRFNASIVGQAVPVFAQVFLAGHAIGVFHGLQNNNAKVGIFAGNPVGIPVQVTVQIRGHATLSVAAQQIQNAVLALAGHASGQFISTIAGSTLNNATVRVAGRATVRAITPTIPLNFTARLGGHATLIASAAVIRTNQGTVRIAGRANASLQGFVQGSFFNNGVVSIAGRSVFSPLPFQSQNAVVGIAGTATLPNFYGRLLQRATVSMAGLATFTPQTPRQTIVWISGNTLQYKVWQYNMESTVRVLGTTWTVQSVGLSFQSIALELVMTEAGWGS